MLLAFGLVVPFLFGIVHMGIADLLCDAAIASNATHATDGRVSAHPAKIDGALARQEQLFSIGR